MGPDPSTFEWADLQACAGGREEAFFLAQIRPIILHPQLYQATRANKSLQLKALVNCSIKSRGCLVLMQPSGLRLLMGVNNGRQLIKGAFKAHRETKKEYCS